MGFTQIVFLGKCQSRVLYWNFTTLLCEMLATNLNYLTELKRAMI